MTNRRQILTGGAALGLYAALGTKAFSQDAPVTLNIWSFGPAFPQAVEAYKAVKPHVTINLTAAPGPEQNIKMRGAIRADGAGLPDIAHIQSRDLPSFLLTNAIADIAPFGVAGLKDDYIPWVWEQFSRGDQVYALPWDVGPMVLFHRPDLFESFGVGVPTTWDEFRSAAETVRSKDKNVYITNTALNGNWITGLFWQAGEKPFAGEGANVTISIANEQALKVAAYWQELIDADLVSLRPGYVAEWFAAMDAGQYLCWPGASWASNAMQRNANASLGKWQLTKLPQWNGGEYITGNLGGSVVSVLDNSPNKAAAAEFLVWLLHGEGSWELIRQGILVPMPKVHETEEFRATRMQLYADQPFLDVVTEAGAAINPERQYSPFEEYIETTMVDELSQVYVKNGTIADALNRTQEKVVAFAQQQGFTVS